MRTLESTLIKEETGSMARGSRRGQAANLALALFPLMRTPSGALFVFDGSTSTLYHIDN